HAAERLRIRNTLVDGFQFMRVSETDQHVAVRKHDEAPWPIQPARYHRHTNLLLQCLVNRRHRRQRKPAAPPPAAFDESDSRRGAGRQRLRILRHGGSTDNNAASADKFPKFLHWHSALSSQSSSLIALPLSVPKVSSLIALPLSVPKVSSLIALRLCGA